MPDLPPIFSPHSFLVLVVTDLLSQDVPLEDVQYLAGHANPNRLRPQLRSPLRCFVKRKGVNVPSATPPSVGGSPGCGRRSRAGTRIDSPTGSPRR